VGKSPAIAIIVTMHQLQSPQPAMNLRPLGAAVVVKSSAANGPPAKLASATIPSPSRPRENQHAES
jgi:hypothetical protein